MYSFILIIHSIICILLIMIVLFQAGKTLGLGGLTGGGSSGDAIMTGTGGNVFLKKITAGLAVMFIITSVTLTVMSANRPSSSLMDIMPPAPVIPDHNPLAVPKPTVETTTTAAKPQS
ncbi:MAG: preprotein translocase subunit SecG [bacterium]|nr:preprotein translocase subunit SecG [bacterium]